MDGFKLLSKHRKGCRCEDDEMAFCITDRDQPIDWRRRRNGHRNGSTMFWRFLCNDPDCSAVLLVRWDVLARFITEGARS